MNTDHICVKIVDGKWGVVLHEQCLDNEKNAEVSIKMNSKEDAVRYARACEQRTGVKVLLPEH